MHRWLYKIARSRWLAISEYQPIITSTDKMAVSSRFATESEDDFRVEMFFFSLFFEIITCVVILKQLFASGAVIIGDY